MLSKNMTLQKLTDIATKLHMDIDELQEIFVQSLLMNSSHVYLHKNDIMKEYKNIKKPYEFLHSDDIDTINGIKEIKENYFGLIDDINKEYEMVNIIHLKRNTKPNIKLNKLDGNEEQKAVMNNLYSSEISILTGGAGTSKTHVILEIVKKSKHDIVVLALTGMCVENFKNKLRKENDIKENNCNVLAMHEEIRKEIYKKYDYYDCNFINKNGKKLIAKQLLLL